MRRGGIGGSEAATVLGLEPYGKTRLDLWHEKTGRVDRTFQGNTATAYGTRIESYILDMLMVDHGYRARSADHQLTHPEHAWMRCNLDGVIMDDDDVIGIVEIKSSSQTLNSDNPHEYHMPQIQHALAVTGLPFCVYAYHVVPMDRELALHIGSEFVSEDMVRSYWSYLARVGSLKILRIERDDAYIERLIEHEAKFWACVEMDLEPPAMLPEGEVEVDDAVLSGLLDAYGEVMAETASYRVPKEIEASKTSINDAIRQRCDVIAGKAGAKKIHTNSGTIIWNARGYWQAKPVAGPAKKPDIDVPF